MTRNVRVRLDKRLSRLKRDGYCGLRAPAD